MATTIFPVAVSSSLNSSAITAVSAGVLYEGRVTFDPAIYQINCASATITNFQFLSNSGTIITSGVTASGTVSINLASTADRIRLWTNTGSNTVITINKTASSLTNQFSGTLDTVTASGNYTGTSTSGFGYAILVGGGGGGGGAQTGGGTNQAGGGGSGALAAKLVSLTGSMAVVIGAFGTGGTAGNAGSNGGTSTFAGMSAGGGIGAIAATGGNARGGGAGGTATGGDVNNSGGDGGGADPFGYGNNGIAAVTPYSFVVNNGTTGGGGAGGYSGNGAGVGLGIGKGGNGGNWSVTASAATGYGAGGGGAAVNQSGGTGVGGNGSPGVLYILRF